MQTPAVDKSTHLPKQATAEKTSLSIQASPERVSSPLSQNTVAMTNDELKLESEVRKFLEVNKEEDVVLLETTEKCIETCEAIGMCCVVGAQVAMVCSAVC